MERPDFTLADTKGRPFRFAQETAGFLTFLFFGYTNCPDICPVHMANLGTVLDRFPADLRRRVRVVFVTTDPERDTPERIDAWLRPFGPAFVGLTGSLEEVNRIQAGLGLPVADRADAAADGGYAVGHSALVLAFPPGRPATWAYPFGTRQEDWLLEIPRLLKEGS